MVRITLMLQATRVELHSLVRHWPLETLATLGMFLFGYHDHTLQLLYEALLVLILIDIVTGTWRAKKQGRFVARDGFGRTAGKFLAYSIVVVVARMLELIVAQAIGVGAVGAIGVKVAIVVLATHEATSIDENLRGAYGIGLGAVLVNLRRLLSTKDGS